MQLGDDIDKAIGAQAFNNHARLVRRRGLQERCQIVAIGTPVAQAGGEGSVVHCQRQVQK